MVGDTVRKLNNESTNFTKDSILNNNYSIIEKCVKAVDQYAFVIVSVIFPYEKTRHYAHKVLKEKYFEIYIKCSPET
jgi:adenylylsulfate kinase-like enzyme